MSYAPERRAGLLFVGVAVCVLIILAIVLLASRSSGLHYTVVFAKGKGVRVGDRVQMNGIDVGEVDRVEFDDKAGTRVKLRLKIASEHRERIQADSTAYIADATFPNVSGQKVIEVANSSSASGPMPEGAVIEGKDGLLEFKAWQLRGKLEEWSVEVRDAAKELGEGAKGATKDLKESAKDYAQSPEAKEVVEKLRKFLVGLPEKARSGMDKAMEEWGKLKAEAGPAIARLKESGKKVLSEKLERLVREIEEQLQKLRDAWEKEPELERSSKTSATPV